VAQGWGPADDALDAAIPHQLPRLRVGNKADLARLFFKDRTHGGLLARRWVFIIRHASLGFKCVYLVPIFASASPLVGPDTPLLECGGFGNGLNSHSKVTQLPATFSESH